jgi:hypothetical protein
MSQHIPLTRGKFALVDDADYPTLSQYRWLYHSSGYAVRAEYVNGKRRFIPMHREIMGAQRGQIVDHIDTDRLNNTRSNLRFVTANQNMWNRSPNEKNSSSYKGVSAHPNGWQVRIRVNKERIHLGYCEDQTEAALLYDAAARHFFGDYARVNFPDFASPPDILAQLQIILQRRTSEGRLTPLQHTPIQINPQLQAAFAALMKVMASSSNTRRALYPGQMSFILHDLHFLYNTEARSTHDPFLKALYGLLTTAKDLGYLDGFV